MRCALQLRAPRCTAPSTAWACVMCSCVSWLAAEVGGWVGGLGDALDCAVQGQTQLAPCCACLGAAPAQSCCSPSLVLCGPPNEQFSCSFSWPGLTAPKPYEPRMSGKGLGSVEPIVRAAGARGRHDIFAQLSDALPSKKDAMAIQWVDPAAELVAHDRCAVLVCTCAHCGPCLRFWSRTVHRLLSGPGNDFRHDKVLPSCHTNMAAVCLAGGRSKQLRASAQRFTCSGCAGQPACMHACMLAQPCMHLAHCGWLGHAGTGMRTLHAWAFQHAGPTF